MPVSTRKVAINLVIKVISAALGFGASIALVQILGSEGYGQYTFFTTTCALLTIFAKSGIDIVVLRNTAVEHDRGNGSAMLGILRNSTIAISITSSIVIGVVAAASSVSPPFSQLLGGLTSVEIFFGVLASTALAVYVGHYRAQGRILESDFTESILKPILTITIAGIAIQLAGAGPSGSAVASAVIATLLAALLLFFRTFTHSKKLAKAGTGNHGDYRFFPPPNAAQFMLYGALSFVLFQLDTLILAYYVPRQQLGAYNMACNFTRIVIFLPIILSGQIQPKLAVAWNNIDATEIRHILRYAYKASTISALGGLLLISLIGYRSLALVAPGFESSYPALIILCVAHVFNAITIVTSAVLLMTRNEGHAVKAQLGGAIVAIPLYLSLIPRFGTLGAAIAAAAGIIITTAGMMFGLQNMQNQLRKKNEILVPQV